MGKDNDNDDIDAIVYQGMVSLDGNDHDSFFGSQTSKRNHFTVQESKRPKPSED